MATPVTAARASSTAVLMADTTHPELTRVTSPGVPYMRYAGLTGWLNSHYANRHGYALLFFMYTEAGCRHPRWGWRHPSYCKLAAIAAALQEWGTVAFIDSDSFFSPTAPPLPELIARRRLAKLQHAATHVLLASDRPFTTGPNCGFMVWRASDQAMALLATWWHLDMGPFGLAHDYEQHALHWVLAHLRRFQSGLVQTLQLRSLELDTTSEVVHVDHTRRGERLWRAGLAILEATAPERKSRRRKLTLARAAKLFAKNSTSDANLSVDRLRMKLLDAVVAAATSWRVHSGHVHVHPREFNATRAAMALLPPRQPQEGDLSGLPLVLRPCSHALRSWQSWSMAADASDERSADHSFGLALTQWQTSCLTAGPSLSLRRPAVPLAQLGDCSTGWLALSSQNKDGRWSFDAGSNASLLNATLTEGLRDEAADAPAASRSPEASSEDDRGSAREAVRLFSRIARALPTSRPVSAERSDEVSPQQVLFVGPAQEAAAQGGKHGAWRARQAEPSRLFQACPWRSNRDKAFQDCESWCRPTRTWAHCRSCKCLACAACHHQANGTTLQVRTLTATQRQRANHRLRREDRLCLAAYRQDVLDGSPLTFVKCRPHMLKAQQRWSIRDLMESSSAILPGRGSRNRGFNLRPHADDTLCVTAYPPS